MRDLPRSFGNLENLEELNMSNNQIRILPDSFRMLSKLRVLIVDGNPLDGSVGVYQFVKMRMDLWVYEGKRVGSCIK
ncbi:hypothetical protein Leryth_026697 [Lithospermum erythrorhizon]|nr:hypothetical protein Leryth_026697 [Lithospermum erythrorhizon]